MAKEPEEEIEGQSPHPERPLECSECKNPIAVHYTEIVGNKTTHTGMCNICPQLQKRLKGMGPEEEIGLAPDTGIVCGECGTTLSNVKVGHMLGCSHCYEVFGDLIVDDLMTVNKISPSIVKKRKTVPLHVGRSPGEVREISPSLQLIALNEALDETLKREDYEQAALLRDQIKELTKSSEDNNGKKK